MGDGGMPFGIAKPSFLKRLELEYKVPHTRYQRLQDLRNGTAFTKVGSVDSVGQNPDPNVPKEAFNDKTLVEWKTHFNVDWLGIDPADLDASGDPVGNAHQPARSATRLTTGWWANWYGDAEGILREGLSRAIEISLDLEKGELRPLDFQRVWPIELFWVCGVRRFQVFISWTPLAGSHEEDGHVTAIILTPAFYRTQAERQRGIPYALATGIKPLAEAAINAKNHNEAAFLVVGTTQDTSLGGGVIGQAGPVIVGEEEP